MDKSLNSKELVLKLPTTSSAASDVGQRVVRENDGPERPLGTAGGSHRHSIGSIDSTMDCNSAQQPLELNMRSFGQSVKESLAKFINRELCSQEDSKISLYTSNIEAKVYATKMAIFSRSAQKPTATPATYYRPRLFSFQVSGNSQQIEQELEGMMDRNILENQFCMSPNTRPETSLAYASANRPETLPPIQTICSPRVDRNSVDSPLLRTPPASSVNQEYEDLIEGLSEFGVKYECYKSDIKATMKLAKTDLQDPDLPVKLGSPNLSAFTKSSMLATNSVLFIDFDDTIHPTSFKHSSKIASIKDCVTNDLKSDFHFLDYQVVS
jgi:hypothetical protein